MRWIIIILFILCIASWQTKLCFSDKSKKRKLMPVVLLSLTILGLVAFSMTGNYLYTIGLPIYNAPLGAMVFAIILMIPLSGISMGWIIYEFAKAIKIRKA